MITPAGHAINEKIAAAMPAYVTERDGLESVAVAWCHVANKSGAPAAALGIKVVAGHLHKKRHL